MNFVMQEKAWIGGQGPYREEFEADSFDGALEYARQEVDIVFIITREKMLLEVSTTDGKVLGRVGIREEAVIIEKWCENVNGYPGSHFSLLTIQEPRYSTSYLLRKQQAQQSYLSRFFLDSRHRPEGAALRPKKYCRIFLYLKRSFLAQGPVVLE